MSLISWVKKISALIYTCIFRCEITKLPWQCWLQNFPYNRQVKTHDCYMIVTWLLHDCYMIVTWLLHDCHMIVTWLLHDCYMIVTQLKLDSLIMILASPPYTVFNGFLPDLHICSPNSLLWLTSLFEISSDHLYIQIDHVDIREANSNPVFIKDEVLIVTLSLIVLSANVF